MVPFPHPHDGPQGDEDGYDSDQEALKAFANTVFGQKMDAIEKNPSMRNLYDDMPVLQQKRTSLLMRMTSVKGIAEGATAGARRGSMLSRTESTRSMNSNTLARRNSALKLDADAQAEAAGAGGGASSSSSRRESLYGREGDTAHLKGSLKKTSMSRRMSATALSVRMAMKKKEVRFAKTVKDVKKQHPHLRYCTDIEYIEMLDEYTTEEIDSIWFTYDEMDEMKQESYAEGQLIDNGMSDQVECIRGLENKTEEGCWSRYKARQNASNAVLDEQDRQWNTTNDPIDWNLIRQVYVEHSIKYHREAHQRGLDDKKDADVILQDTKAEYDAYRRAKEQLLRRSRALSKQQDADHEAAPPPECALPTTKTSSPSEGRPKRGMLAKALSSCGNNNNNSSKKAPSKRNLMQGMFGIQDSMVTHAKTMAPTTTRQPSKRSSWFVRKSAKFENTGSKTVLKPGVGLTTASVVELTEKTSQSEQPWCSTSPTTNCTVVAATA